MQRTITVILLLSLVVAICFVTTSCKKGGVFGLKVPSQSGLYLDLGDDWKSSSQIPWTNQGSISLTDTIAFAARFDREQKVELKSSVIKVGTRSMGWTYQQADNVLLIPLLLKQVPGVATMYEDGYVSAPGALSKASVNESKPEENYTYVELNVPPSPSGYYLLCVCRESNAFMDSYQGVFLHRAGS